MKTLFLILLFLFGMTFTAAAQSAKADSVYDSADSIVVIANRYSVSLRNVAYGYQVIPAERIKKLATHSAMEMVDIEFPSAYVMEKKVIGYGVGPQGSGQVYLRGLGGQPNTGVLVLLNGHPDFMGIFGHPLPDVDGADDVQQVEILSGASSTVFGGNAMGGVVNIVTQPDYDRFMRLSMTGGSFGTYDYGLNLSKQFGAHGLYLTARSQQTDGHIAQSGFKALRLQGGWAWQFSPEWNLSVSGRWVPYSFDDPSRGQEDPAGLGTYAKIERGTGEIKLDNRHKNWQGTTQLYANFGYHRFYDGFKSNDFSYGLSSYQFWNYSDRLQFAGGIDVLYYGGQAKNPFAKLPWGAPVVKEDKKAYQSLGAYLLGFYQPARFLQIKAGLRYQTLTSFSSRVSPLAVVTLQPAQSYSIYAAYKSGFRFPTMRELYLFPSANEALKEESVQTYEAGLTYTLNKTTRFRLAFYRNQVDNIIQLVPATPPNQFRNSGAATQTGIESQIQFQPFGHWKVQLSYAYLNPDDLTAYNPKHQVKYMAGRSWKSFSVILYGKYVQDLYALNNHQKPLPDYFLLNAAFNYLFRQFGLSLKLLNILDRSYLVSSGYSAPRFHILAGIDFEL